jgi:DNA-binding transcriptional LysR family regulator
VLRRNDEFRAALDELRSEVAGLVRVAAIYSVGISEMAELEEEFGRRHPDARLEVEYLRPEKVYEAVLMDRADLGLVSYAEPAREISVQPWRNEEMVVSARPDHPLMRKVQVEPQDLQDLDFIAFDDDLPISRDIARYLRSHGVEVNATMHFDNIQTIKEAVMLGSGVTIVPLRILRAEMAAGRLSAAPLAFPLSRPLAIIQRKKKRLNRAAQVFLNVLQEHRTSGPVLAVPTQHSANSGDS